jgi:hypothetical protein
MTRYRLYGGDMCMCAEGPFDLFTPLLTPTGFSLMTRRRAKIFSFRHFFIYRSSVMTTCTRIGPLKTSIVIYSCGKVMLGGPRPPVASIAHEPKDWSTIKPGGITSLLQSSYLIGERYIAFYEAHMRAEAERTGRGPSGRVSTV